MLSLFQGPMLALLLLGAFTQRVTASAGMFTLITGVILAAVVLLMGTNMLYTAFVSFVYSLVALWVVSGFTEKHSPEQLTNLVYTPWRRT